MSDIGKFPSEVIEKLQYYVYRLIDPRNGETFYVGKGKGNRVFSHIELFLSSDSFDEESDKLQTIRAIKLAGLRVIHVIHRHGLDEKTAFEVEAALIDAYPSSTNIIGGSHSDERGPMHSSEIIERYAAEEIEIKHKIIFIKINKSKLDKNIYDATRMAWKLSKDKAGQADYVLSVYNGIVVGVFKPTIWLETIKDNFPEIETECPGRFGFIGENADPDVLEMYLRKKIPATFKIKGAANPIKYSYK